MQDSMHISCCMMCKISTKGRKYSFVSTSHILFPSTYCFIRYKNAHHCFPKESSTKYFIPIIESHILQMTRWNDGTLDILNTYKNNYRINMYTFLHKTLVFLHKLCGWQDMGNIKHKIVWKNVQFCVFEFDFRRNSVFLAKIEHIVHIQIYFTIRLCKKLHYSTSWFLKISIPIKTCLRPDYFDVDMVMTRRA